MAGLPLIDADQASSVYGVAVTREIIPDVAYAGPELASADVLFSFLRGSDSWEEDFSFQTFSTLAGLRAGTNGTVKFTFIQNYASGDGLSGIYVWNPTVPANTPDVGGIYIKPDSISLSSAGRYQRFISELFVPVEVWGILPAFQGTPYEAKTGLVGAASQHLRIRAATTEASSNDYAGLAFNKGFYLCNECGYDGAFPDTFRWTGAGPRATYICRNVQDATLMVTNPNVLCMIRGPSENLYLSDLSIAMFGFDPLNFIWPAGADKTSRTQMVGPFTTIQPIVYRHTTELRPSYFQLASASLRRAVSGITVTTPGVNGVIRVTTTTPHNFRWNDPDSDEDADIANTVCFSDVVGMTQLNGADRFFGPYTIVDEVTVDVTVPDTGALTAYTSGGYVVSRIDFVVDPPTGRITLTRDAQLSNPDEDTIYTIFFAMRTSLQSAIRGDGCVKPILHNVGIFGPWYVGARFPNTQGLRSNGCIFSGVIDRGVQATNEGFDNTINDFYAEGLHWLTPRFALKRLQEIKSASFNILSITNSFPAVVTTATAHSFVRGDTVSINIPEVDVSLKVNMWEINDEICHVGTVISSTQFELFNFDTTPFTPYVDDGTCYSSVIEVACAQITGLFEGCEVLLDELDGFFKLNNESYTVRNLSSATVGGVACDVFQLVNLLGNKEGLIAVTTGGLELGNTWVDGTGWVARSIRSTSYNVETGVGSASQRRLAILNGVSRRASTRCCSVTGGNRGVMVQGNRFEFGAALGYLALGLQQPSPRYQSIRNNIIVGCATFGVLGIDVRGFDCDNIIEGCGQAAYYFQNSAGLNVQGVCAGRNVDLSVGENINRALYLNGCAGVKFDISSFGHWEGLHMLDSTDVAGTLHSFGDQNGILMALSAAVADFDYNTDVKLRSKTTVVRAVWQSAAFGTGLTVSGVALGAGNSIADSATHKYLNDYSGLVQTGGVVSRARVYRGSGSPESVVTAPIGSLYQRSDGSGATAYYYKGSGTGNTGWLDHGAIAGIGSDLLAIEALSGTSGGLFKTAANTWALRSLTQGTGVTITNPAGVAGDPTFALTSPVLGKQPIYIPAGAMIPRLTNGPEPYLAELSTSKIMVAGLAFDQSTVENAQFSMRLPKFWNEGTVLFAVHWTAVGAPTGNAIWSLAARAFSDDDPLDTATGTAGEVTDAFITANDEHVTAFSSAVTIAGTPAVADRCIFNLSRKASDGSDTLTADAILLGVYVQYTNDAMIDD